MQSSEGFFIMNNFPDFHQSCFDINQYNKTFEKKNVIIHAYAKNVSYNEHWGPLSIKCVMKGAEHYQCNQRFYTVDKNAYLVLNEGQHYSSYIYSDTATESFTINFSSQFQQSVSAGFKNNLDAFNETTNFECIEKLYLHDGIITPLLKKLYKASVVRSHDFFLINELYYLLFENLLLQQAKLKNEIRKVKAVKYSTQLELYKRLNYAKDFIHSCYMKEITLDDLAAVACLNNAYFLREFKKYFGLSPYQYIIQTRLNTAKNLLKTTSYKIEEICFEVGYSDAASFNKLFKKNFALTPAEYRIAKTKKSIFTC